MPHKISVDTDLDIMDGQRFEKKCFFKKFSFFEFSFESLYSRFIPLTWTGKNKVYNSHKCRRYTWQISGKHMWPNLAGLISPCLIEDPRGRHFWVFSDQIFCSDFLMKFFDRKSLLRDHTGANVSLAKF